jgi:hypothetical protein
LQAMQNVLSRFILTCMNTETTAHEEICHTVCRFDKY